VRFDSAEDADTPVTITVPGGQLVLDGAVNSTNAGQLPTHIQAEVATLYQKAFDDYGHQVGSTVELAAIPPEVAPPATSVPTPESGDEGKFVAVSDPASGGYELVAAPSGGGGAATRTTFTVTPATLDRHVIVEIPAGSVIMSFAGEPVSEDTTGRDSIDISFESPDGSGDEGTSIAFFPATPGEEIWTSWNTAHPVGGSIMRAQLPATIAIDTKIRVYRFGGDGPGDGEYQFTVNWIPVGS
jgi:hypothetical protein